MIKISTMPNFIQVALYLNSNNLKDELNSNSELRQEVYEYILNQSFSIGPKLFDYWNKYYLSSSQKQQLHELSTEFMQMSLFLNLYYGKQLELNLDQNGYNEKIETYISRAQIDQVNDFNYVIKGIPSHYIASIGNNDIQSVPSIGFHNIFINEINLEDSQLETWITICYYSEKTKKQIINDAFVLNTLK